MVNRELGLSGVLACCVGLLGVGVAHAGPAVPPGASTWRAVGLDYVEVMHVVRAGKTVRTLDSGGPYGEMSCRSLSMSGDRGVGRAFGYGSPRRVKVRFTRSGDFLAVKQSGGGYSYTQKYARSTTAKANRQLARQWDVAARGFLQKQFRKVCL